ncbi:MAG: SGNH/GDSL hydrolase family protein [Saprospiraceae bacterium]
MASARIKAFSLGLTTVLIAFIAITMIGELFFRGYYWSRGRTFSNKDHNIVLTRNIPDTLLGWKPTPFFETTEIRKDAGGNSYEVHYTADKHGFRQYGDIGTKKIKVLLIGDSFTQANHASTAETYYTLLQDSLNWEIFTFGCSGYGTLQEYLVLDLFMDTIRPDLVLFQYCHNDLINNSFPLERASLWNNNGTRRPYWSENGIYYDIPKRFHGLRTFANTHSRLLFFIFNRIDRLKSHFSTESVETKIAELGKSFPDYAESLKVTDEIFQLIRKRTPSSVPVCIFAADNAPPFYSDVKTVAQKNGFLFIEGIPEAVALAAKEGKIVHYQDGAHWSPEGHRIVANTLMQYFRKNPLF